MVGGIISDGSKNIVGHFLSIIKPRHTKENSTSAWCDHCMCARLYDRWAKI